MGGAALKNVLLIKNPIAGKDSKRIETSEIISAFKKFGIDCFEKTTTCHGDAVEIAKKHSPDFDAVICCGGDGTYNEVVNGMMLAGVDIPVIYIPCGSTNDFANTLGISNDPREAAQMYIDGLVNKYDVGKFNDQYFCYIASFGVATDISYNTSQKIKNMLGHSAYLINGFVIRLVPMLKNLKPVHMRVEYDDGVIEDDFYFGAIGNTNEISGIFKLDKLNIKMNDGLFELLLVKGDSVKDVVEAFFKGLRQDFTGENILLVKTSKVKITTKDNVPWTLDGEYFSSCEEIEISVEKEAVNVVSPNIKFLI